METCKLPNFKFSGRNVKFTFEPGGELNKYKKDIKDYIFEKKWFALSEEESLFPQEWEDSIKSLFSVLRNIAKKSKIGPVADEAVDSVEKEFLEKIIVVSLEEGAEDNQPELPQGDLPKKKIKEEIKINLALNTIFKGDKILLLDFNDNFKHSIFGLAIILIGDNIESSNLVTDLRSMNIGIINYLNSEYKKIYKFLSDREEDLSGIPEDMFEVDKRKNEFGSYSDSYKNLLDKFYEYLTKLENFDKILYESYEDKYQNKQHDILDATYAFLNVKYFDKLLISNGGKYFYVDFNSINVIKKNDNGSYTYRYRVNKKSQLSSGWDTKTVRDGIEELGNFSVFVMEQVPLKNSIGHLTKNDFITSLLKLQHAIKHLKSTSRNDDTVVKLKKALYKTTYDISEGWRDLLEIVHDMIVNDNVASLVSFSELKILNADEKTLKGSQLTLVDLDNIDSIYHYFFNKTNGVYYILKNATFNKGIPETYDLISSVFGSVNSTTQAHYLEVVYDYSTRRYITRIKVKNNSYNDVHELKKSIENYTISGNEIDPNFVMDLDSRRIGYGKFIVNPGKSSLNGIFSLTSLSLKMEGIGSNTYLDSYFREQIEKLSILNGRNELLEGKSLDTKDAEFIELLRFIDSNLTTSYSINELGLQELRTLILIQNNKTKKNRIILSLFLNSLRVSAAKKINITLKNKNTNESNINYINDESNKSKFPQCSFIQGTIKDDSSQLKLVDEEYWIKGLDLGISTSELLDDIIKSKNIIGRQDNKAVTKNLDRKSIPNTSVFFTDIISEFYSQGNSQVHNKNVDSYITKNLLFSGNKADAILSTVIDCDLLSYYNDKSLISEFSTQELFLHNFIDKFLRPIREGIFISQPITYSDKKKFLNFAVDLSSIEGYKGIKTTSIFNFKESDHIAIMDRTIGSYYRDLFLKIANDYRRIFRNIYFLQTKRDISSISNLQVFRFANEIMKTKSELWLVQQASNIGITLYKDLHYRNLNGKTSINEILYYYANYVFNDSTNLSAFLNKEKAAFINLLLDTYTLILYNEDVKINGVNVFVDLDEKYLVLGRRNGVDLKFGDKVTAEEIASGKVKLNPLLNTYFYLSNVINNNIKLGLVGHELHHKIKSLGNIVSNLNKVSGLDENSTILDTESLIESKYKLISDLNNSIQNLQDTDIVKQLNSEGKVVKRTVSDIKEDIQTLYNDLIRIEDAFHSSIYSLISLAQGAQFKRTVAIPGTIRPYDLGKLNGITSTYNVAFIDDIKAYINDFKGKYGWSAKEDKDGFFNYNKSKNEDSHDGSALIDPFTSILENNSLDDSAVGDVKKPLWDIDDPIYGARGLVKYACNTITNKLMLQSKRSSLMLHNLFKKMTDSMTWDDSEIDLTKDWAITGSYNAKTSFKKYILDKNSGLYYKIGDEYRLILNFGRDESGAYYTLETKVGSSGGNLNDGIKKVYHLFEKETSKHIRVTSLPANWKEKYTTINSLYKLHSAMGGIYSCSLVNGDLVYSEASNKAVTQFMIYVSKPSESLIKKLENSKLIEKNNNSVGAKPSQEDFYQPLKYKLINCIVNDSAVKNGASNINPSSSYYDDTKLKYVTVSTKKYGILQDSDHEADEAELSEMTQVISALDATGIYHDDVYDIYRAIGEQITNGLQLELEALKDPEDRNKLYDLIGKTIINNFKDRRGMIKAVVDQLEKVFNLSTNHEYDKTLCPFSDATLYNKIIQTLGTIINKKGIKRKYYGSGMVMVPGYDIYLLWEIDGIPMQYEDVLEQAIEFNREQAVPEVLGEFEDQESFYSRIVENYLNNKLPDNVLYEYNDGKIENELGFSLVNVQPESTVTVNYIVNGKTKTKKIKLDSVPKYYEFKNNTLNFLKNLDKLNITDNILITSIVQNNKVPRNLAPARIKFTYKNNIGISYTINIFDTLLYKKLYESIKTKDKASADLWRSRIKVFLKSIEDGIYLEWDDEGNVSQYEITNKEERLAETIMSNMYKTNFGIKDGDSLYKILKTGPGYFRKKINSLDGQIYDFDILLISENGKNNIYVSLDELDNNNSYNTTYVKWDILHQNKVRIDDNKRHNSKVINSIYLINDDNENLFEIAREINVSNEIYFNTIKNKFLYKSNNKEVTDRKIFLDGDIVVERIEFITLNRITSKEGDVSFIRYNINQNNLKKVLLPGETISNKISDIIKSFYKVDSFLAIQPSYNIKAKNYNQVCNFFKSIIDDNSIDEDIRNYSNSIINNVFTFGESNILETSKNNGYIQLNSGRQKSIFKQNILDKYGLSIKDKNGKKLPPSAILYNLTVYGRKNPEKRKEISELIKDYTRSTLEYWNGLFIDKHINKKFTSFKKSLEFISSRIPAQTLQSFMTMLCVGYTGLDTSYCAVSHFLTFLQGSDYDIDKSYMMGLGFDNSGLYYKWSDLFNFTSIETLKASEYLPLPKKYKYFNIKSGRGINITDLCIEILSLRQNDPNRILKIANLLKSIYRNKNLSLFFYPKTNIVHLYINPNKVNESDINKILEILNKHEQTNIPISSKDLILKNFISSNILHISLALGNLDESYTPVEMDDLRNPAKDTPKSKLASSLTLFNPLMINIMQFQNMAGKQVTGIAANAQKALFMWRTATLEAFKNGTNDDINNVRFDITLRGIEGRKNGRIETTRITSLPELNTDNLAYKLLRTLSPKISSDNIGSLYISAATDNAKELILACINAGTKMAKCHLYLAALGFDVNDIVAFMTSDAVSFIDKITDRNIYNNTKLDINYALTWAIDYLNDPENTKDLKGVPDVIMDSFKLEIRSKGPEFENDLITFLTVLRGANEFSQFGRILGINQGVPLTKEDLTSWKNSLRNVIKEAEKRFVNKKTKEYDEEKLKSVGVTSEHDSVRGDNFDVNRWLSDPEYRKLTADYYNKIKTSLNIFHFIDNIPHFKEMFLGVYVLNETDARISLKGKLINKFSDELRNVYPYAPSGFEKRFESAIDELFIEYFIKLLNISIKVEEGWLQFNSLFLQVPITTDGNLELNSDEALSSFRYIFEEYIIPKLKNGTLNIGSKATEEIRKNPMILTFLNGLVLGENEDVPFYKMNLNMTLKDTDASTKIKYSKFLKGIKELKKYNWGDHNLTDLFILYNLIVNKNQYGSERLTELFEDFITDFENRKGQEESIIMKYLRYLGKQDYYSEILSLIEENSTLLDLLIKTSKKVSKKLLPNQKDPVVKVFTDKGIIYYENVGYSNYKPIENPLILIDGESEAEYKTRLKNQYKYGFGLPYMNYILNMISLLQSEKSSDVNSALDTLIKSGIILYYTKCDE